MLFHPNYRLGDALSCPSAKPWCREDRPDVTNTLKHCMGNGDGTDLSGRKAKFMWILLGLRGGTLQDI